MNNKKPALIAPINLLDGLAISPEDFASMVKIDALSNQMSELFGSLSGDAQSFISNTYSDESVLAMSGRNCASEAVESICKAYPKLIHHQPAEADGPALASAFFEELLDSVETLGGIARGYGDTTLCDLMYLQNAILSGTSIDHQDGSHVLDAVSSLPNSDLWLPFVNKAPKPTMKM